MNISGKKYFILILPRCFVVIIAKLCYYFYVESKKPKGEKFEKINKSIFSCSSTEQQPDGG